MFTQLKELMAAIVAAIRDGISDGQKLAKLVIACIENGTLYNVSRHPETGEILKDENGEIVKGKFEFGEQIVPALMDLYLMIENNLGTEGSKFGEFKRIAISAARYAAEHYGLDWAPVRTPEGFKISLGDEPAKIWNMIHQKLPADKSVGVLKAGLSALNPEQREAVLAEVSTAS